MGDGSIRALLGTLHAARIDGELERLCELFDPGARFRIAGSSEGRAVAISAQGGAAIRSWLAILLKSFRLSTYERIGLVIEGDRAAVHWRTEIHSKITGATVRTELIDWVEVHSERIIRYTELFVPI